MDVHFTRIVLRIHSPFGQVLFHGRTYTVGIGVEQQQTFRQLAIVQSFAFQQVGNDSLVGTFSYQSRNVLTFVLDAFGIQCRIESELGDLTEELLLKCVGRFIILG